MNAALKIASDKDVKKLAFSNHALEELKAVSTTFENALKQYEADIQVQSEKNKNYKEVFDKAQLYVMHFIQVLFMTIQRGELKEEILTFYQLDEIKGNVPSLNTEEDLLKWGNNIIAGEQKRMQKGGSPVYSPSIALVKVNVEKFNEAAIFQKNLKRNTLRSYERMQKLRQSTNEFISRLWNEIEANFGAEPSKIRRQRAQQYGVVYVFRKKEKKKLKSGDLQTDLLFDFE